MEMKTLFPKRKERTITSPWKLEEISNGLRARSVKVLNGVVVKANKKVPVQYFEYDRIFGTGAFTTILKVMEMFDELQEITPDSIGYIFKEHIYLYHSKGILKRNNKTGDEDYFSEPTLRNTAISCYLNLNYNQNSICDEGNSNRCEVLSQSTELETVESQG